jgi:tRNA(fMet)-specific endonuclease VapC
MALMYVLAMIDILDYGHKAAIEYGEIRADLQKRGCPIGNMDMLIAAHAKSANMALVTNNIREFERIHGLSIEDWSI